MLSGCFDHQRWSNDCEVDRVCQMLSTLNVKKYMHDYVYICIYNIYSIYRYRYRELERYIYREREIQIEREGGGGKVRSEKRKGWDVERMKEQTITERNALECSKKRKRKREIEIER